MGIKMNQKDFDLLDAVLEDYEKNGKSDFLKADALL